MRKLSRLLFKAERIEIKLHKTISIVEANKRFPRVNSFLVSQSSSYRSAVASTCGNWIGEGRKILKRFGIQMIRNQSFLKSFHWKLLGRSNWIPTSFQARFLSFSRLSAYAAVSLFCSFIKLRVVREKQN